MKSIGALVIIVLLLAGCSVLKVASKEPTAVAYVGGELAATYESADVLETFDASRAALKDFNMTIVNVQKDQTGGVIDARRPDGTNVTVSLRKQGENDTLATIRVGPSGDEEYSRAISNRIAAHLQG